MSQSFHRPEGLERRQLERLEEYVQRGQLMAPDHLLQSAYAHLEDIQGLPTPPGDAELELAAAICHVLDRIVSEWDAFSPVEQSWLRGVMWYFAKSNDACHDHRQGGFRDDAEVLNACLRYVRRDEWMLSLGENAS
ncbi:MAG: hypothetical protein MUF48_14495 [Pirellulaceae bacterium]|nr:hypothetical protein [Pirellulaceae bacterium]